LLLNQVRMEDVLQQASEAYHLTQREKEIISYWMKDFNYRQIALLLGISQNTVKVHISRINLKLNVNSKASLILRLIGA
jgi:DNA-binding CsgD family transcriptional regulator